MLVHVQQSMILQRHDVKPSYIFIGMHATHQGGYMYKSGRGPIYYCNTVRYQDCCTLIADTSLYSRMVKLLVSLIHILSSFTSVSSVEVCSAKNPHSFKPSQLTGTVISMVTQCLASSKPEESRWHLPNMCHTEEVVCHPSSGIVGGGGWPLLFPLGGLAPTFCKLKNNHKAL